MKLKFLKIEKPERTQIFHSFHFSVLLILFSPLTSNYASARVPDLKGYKITVNCNELKDKPSTFNLGGSLTLGDTEDHSCQGDATHDFTLKSWCTNVSVNWSEASA